jgi:hypothetical protein
MPPVQFAIASDSNDKIKIQVQASLAMSDTPTRFWGYFIATALFIFT